MQKRTAIVSRTVALAALALMIAAPFAAPVLAKVGSSTTCPPFYLRDEAGRIINPVTGENTDQPYSTRQTCGACHDYETITKGYHFQQGWDEIRDDFSDEKPWVLSPGMMGKH